MNFKGHQPLSLIDYPRKMCAVLFTGGCSFHCYFCHNPELVVDYKKLPDIPGAQILKFLDGRRGFLDGICITGGEPTLWKELPDFMKQVKDMNFLIKLDTNGTNPEFLTSVIENKLVDYVAMDIKTTPAKYPDVVEIENIDISKIDESIKILLNSTIEYEFRTTVFPEFFSQIDAQEIGHWIKGAKSYILQKPRTIKMLSKGRFKEKDIPLYTDAELLKLATFLPNCTVR
ncbi:MAG: anaerobic ribonucleoside-triphosphate reductase activating protein [bacterium]|nr:anaerobic ribonucleoside-triphosphate reductase activating protein [bacterium]